MNKTKISYSAFVAMAALCCTVIFVGCGEDDSASVNDEFVETIGSSGEEEDAESSSSVKDESSSSEKKKSSSSKEQIESSSSVKEVDQSSSSEENALEEKLGKCEDLGMYTVRHVQDVSGKWYSCYRGNWSAGMLVVESREWGEWGKISYGVASSSEEPESSSSYDSSSSSSEETIPSSSGVFDWSLPKDTYLNPDIQYDSIVDERDGQVYKTVKIGDQVWMAQNLNYYDTLEMPELKGRATCFGDKPENCAVAGRFYAWTVAIDSAALANDAENPQTCGYRMACNLPARVRGVCPENWHLPDTTEWNALFKAVGGADVANTILKSKMGWNVEEEEGRNGTDDYGFSVIPVGYDYLNFDYDGSHAVFWQLTEKDELNVYAVGFSYYSEGVYLYNSVKAYRLSVRCVKD